MKKVLFPILVLVLALILGGVTTMLAAPPVPPVRPPGTGTEFDIRGGAGVTPVLVNDALFLEWTVADASGTGIYQPFLHCDNNTCTLQGYSSDYEPPQFDEVRKWTYAIQLSELPIVDWNGTYYREFTMDANQEGGTYAKYLTLEQMKVYQTNNNTLHNYPTGWPAPIWDLDGGEDRFVTYNGQYSAGSGKLDVKIFIPDSLFAAAEQYVIVYMQWGYDPYYCDNDGFEELGYIIYPEGCLNITKTVNWSGAVPDVNQTFTITVDGPDETMPVNITFDYLGNPNITLPLENLALGLYNITESDPGAGWAVDPPGLVQQILVTPYEGEGDVCESVSFTNTLQTGCLRIVKEVDLSSVVGPIANIPDVDFTITVTGPSYPNGTDLTFNLINGVISGAQDLDDIIPGNYTVAETPPAGWNLDSIVTSPATVNAGDVCGVNATVVTVTNTPIPGCLNITKEIDMGDMIDGGLDDLEDATFSINVTGPSYPNGTDVVFNLTGGVVEGPDNGNSTCLCNLIPGNYTVTEAGVAGWEAANITGDDPACVV